MEVDPTNGLLFIDVDAKAPIPAIKEELPSSPDEKLSDVKNNEGKEKLHCAECDRFTCYSADRMMRHIRKVHRGQNPFQCVMCDYSTYNTVCFTDHVNIHKGIKPYKCQHCPYRTVSKKYIKLHETKHGTCDQCGYLAKSRPELRRHARECSAAGTPASRGKGGKYACASCNMHYDSKLGLAQHKKNHKTCPHCKEAFMPSVLNTHLTEVHGVEVQPGKKNFTYKFQCQQCEWHSNYQQKILLHLIHHPVKDLQLLDESIDVTPLIKAGILTRAS